MRWPQRGPEDALAVVRTARECGAARLALEREQGPKVIAAAEGQAAAEKMEAQVIAAWIKWYWRSARQCRDALRDARFTRITGADQLAKGQWKRCVSRLAAAAPIVTL